MAAMSTRYAAGYQPDHAPARSLRPWYRRPLAWIAAGAVAAVLAVTLALTLFGGGASQWTPQQVALFTGNIRPGVSAPAWLTP
jgi:hypothetical protein